MFDVVLAASSLIALAPVMAGVAFAVKMTSRGPVLFRQERVGRAGTGFELLKFRSMADGSSDVAQRDMNRRELRGESVADDGINKLKHDPRVTRVGSFIRRYSIDELPQLWNVLRGDMSIVGPRPSLSWEVELYSNRHRRREVVRPGLTGLWQVGGRNRLTMIEMLDLDVQYVDTLSLTTDIRILTKTPRAVLSGDGAR